MIGFASHRIRADRRAAEKIPNGTVRSQRPFARPQGLPLTRVPLRGQRSRPAASLPNPPTFPPARSFAPLPISGLPRFWAVSLRQTRCGIAAGLCRLRFQLPLPFRTVTSLGINASASFAASQSAFRGCPISVRSPPPDSIASIGCGSPFPARYRLAGSLFLKPLGTFFTMLPKPFFVNAFCASACPFQQLLFRLLRACYGNTTVQELCIKRELRILFSTASVPY